MPSEPQTADHAVPEAFDSSADVIVIGAGPTGCTYARTIIDEAPDARVLLVEAGPAATVPPGLHVANIESSSHRTAVQIAFQGPFPHAYPKLSHDEVARADHETLNATLTKRPGLWSLAEPSGPSDFPAAQASSGVGGMGSHWFGACPRPAGSERIDLIAREVLDDAYDEAERMLRVGNDRFTDRRMAERIRSRISRVVDDGREPSRRVQQMPMALVATPTGVHRSGPDVILGDAVDRGLEVRADTLARRILMEGGRAVGVVLEDRLTGRMTSVSARHVVVAANSVHTPQLLFASGIRPAALGRHLNEHPQVSLMAVLEDGDALGDVSDAAGTADGESGTTGVMSDPSAMAIASSGVTWIPFDGDRFPFHSQVSHVDPTTLGLSDAEVATLGPVISLAFFLPQELDPENRVWFSETETDWRGMPAPRFRYRLSVGDRRVIARAKETLKDIANSLGRPLKAEEPRELPAGSSLHYQGTVRMGATDDGASVCDPGSRVWGTENVRVAGNGVIPTSTACNPTLTSVALAIIGARAIADELRHKEKTCVSEHPFGRGNGMAPTTERSRASATRASVQPS
ncbi:GMC oxidoreductase [Gryllotalpicola reticulitermitis]|uniref:GMC oxidoreductase n=1 Tax=Gryllotalpicola reticulitermitis TaxID=1184153 RepID=A0ABV8Q6U6_9MICO